MKTSHIILLIIAVVLLFVMFVIPFIVYKSRDPDTYALIFVIIVVICLVILFVYIGKMINSSYQKSLGFLVTNQDMIVMDSLWYIICLVFLCTVIALIVKLIMEGSIRKNLALASISTTLILLTYTIIYYIVFFYEYIGMVMMFMTILVASIIGALFLARRFLNYDAIVNNIYVLLSITSFIYVACIFIYIFYVIEKSYDYLT